MVLPRHSPCRGCGAERLWLPGEAHVRRGVFSPRTRRVAASSGEAGSPLDPWQPPEPPAGAVPLRRALERTSDAVSAETGERPPAAAPARAGSTGRCPSPTVGSGMEWQRERESSRAGGCGSQAGTTRRTGHPGRSALGGTKAVPEGRLRLPQPRRRGGLRLIA